MHLMLQILNWDFQYSSGDRAKANVDIFAANAGNDTAYSRRSECVPVQVMLFLFTEWSSAFILICCFSFITETSLETFYRLTSVEKP